MIPARSRRRPPPATMPRWPDRLGLRARPGRWQPAAVGLGTAVAALVVLVGVAEPAWAQVPDPTLGQVIDRLRLVLVGLLGGLATLFLTVGGVRYLFAGADPGQVEKAKAALRAAAVGYGLAVLAPVLTGLLRYVVGA
jgi:hypothetical protein